MGEILLKEIKRLILEGDIRHNAFLEISRLLVIHLLIFMTSSKY
jgi:hypothetical protein